MLQKFFIICVLPLMLSNVGNKKVRGEQLDEAKEVTGLCGVPGGEALSDSFHHLTICEGPLCVCESLDWVLCRDFGDVSCKSTGQKSRPLTLFLQWV